MAWFRNVSERSFSNKIFRPFAEPTVLPFETPANIYGVTIHQDVTTCRHFDRFVVSLVRANLIVGTDSDCIMTLCGAALGSSYGHVVRSVYFLSLLDATRTIKFACIAWPQQHLRDLVYSTSKGHVYTVIFTNDVIMRPDPVARGRGVLSAQQLSVNEWVCLSRKFAPPRSPL